MKKQDFIDALGAYGLTRAKLDKMTIEQMADKLRELRKADDKIPEKPKNLNIVEITRSYSRKLDLGNYESADFFCSQKAEVTEDDDLKAVSAWLAYQCQLDVMRQIELKIGQKANNDEIDF